LNTLRYQPELKTHALTRDTALASLADLTEQAAGIARRQDQLVAQA
jgi:hypothetical protein